MENQNPQPTIPVQKSNTTPNANIPPTPPPSPIKPSRKFSVKIIIGIVVFLLLAGGAAAGYIFREQLDLVSKPNPTLTPITTVTPTPNPTADWKTYTNNSLGYTLKYPTNWNIASPGFETGILLQTEELQITDFSNVAKGAFIYGPYEPRITINYFSLDALKNEYLNLENKIIIQEKDIPLDGQPAKMLVIKHTDAYSIEVVFQNKQPGDVRYSFISLVSEIESFEVYQEQFDQILSTFKFTGPAISTTPTQAPRVTYTTTPNPTANWKAFSNSSVGLEFKYPNTWYLQQDQKWTLQTYLENHPFEIPQAATFVSAIQIGLSETMDYTTNTRSYQFATLDEAITLHKTLYNPNTMVVENLNIAGKSAIRITGDPIPGPMENFELIFYYIQLKNRVLAIQVKNESESIAKQILTTFKFTN